MIQHIPLRRMDRGKSSMARGFLSQKDAQSARHIHRCYISKKIKFFLYKCMAVTIADDMHITANVRQNDRFAPQLFLHVVSFCSSSNE
ncbi:hypothetical protein F2P81_022000 [Scophthalmus maximus]|uniref:Uncharacterized protein n=1 Tax=Scophthalmus maximus TaxID=52904 RepID=A0A6A4RXR9_SCOMX|nr:hypothetical protein F2P81_022000 [Scophthalmus maximus]